MGERNVRSVINIANDPQAYNLGMESMLIWTTTKNVSCGCTGKILKTLYLDCLNFKEYHSTPVLYRTCRCSDTEVETHFDCGVI